MYIHLMQVCFSQHTHAVLHSLKIGPLSFWATHLVFLYMHVCMLMMHSYSALIWTCWLGCQWARGTAPRLLQSCRTFWTGRSWSCQLWHCPACTVGAWQQTLSSTWPWSSVHLFRKSKSKSYAQGGIKRKSVFGLWQCFCSLREIYLRHVSWWASDNSK